jgi:hypothetical protein
MSQVGRRPEYLMIIEGRSDRVVMCLPRFVQRNPVSRGTQTVKTRHRVYAEKIYQLFQLSLKPLSPVPDEGIEFVGVGKEHDYLIQQITRRFNLQKWTATFADGADCTFYAASRDKAWGEARRRGNLKFLELALKDCDA